mgnify:FL=1
MLKILKELKPFTILIFIIIGLLFLQAMTELALPDYMSNIVNVGIQQSGIENAVPKVIKEEGMAKIKIFLDENQKNFIDESYKLIGKENLTDEEYNKYFNEYPALEEENLYILNTSSKEDIEYIDSFLGKFLFIVLNIEKGASQGIIPNLP